MYSWQSVHLCYNNSLRPRQNGRHFADDTFKCIFLNENVWISLQISLKFVPEGSINKSPSLVWIMAWCRPGDKPLSEPMMVILPTHICVITRPLWVNGSDLLLWKGRFTTTLWLCKLFSQYKTENEMVFTLNVALSLFFGRVAGLSSAGNLTVSRGYTRAKYSLKWWCYFYSQLKNPKNFALINMMSVLTFGNNICSAQHRTTLHRW